MCRFIAAFVTTVAIFAGCSAVFFFCWAWFWFLDEVCGFDEFGSVGATVFLLAFLVVWAASHEPHPSKDS